MTAWFSRLTWSQRVGSLFGATYVLVGVVGFIVTSGLGFFALRGNDLIVLELNPLHNVVHLGIGAALLYAALNSPAASRLMNRLIGATYLIVAVVGFGVVQADSTLFRGLVQTRSELNILALNHPDNLLHVASALVLIGSTLVGHRRRSDAVAEPEPADTAAATGQIDTIRVDEDVPDQLARPAPTPARSKSRLRAGDIAPTSGSYRCACGRFSVDIRADRELPDCPEPTGTDDDHFFKLERRSSPAKPGPRSKAKPKATAPAKRAGGTRPRAKSSGRR